MPLFRTAFAGLTSSQQPCRPGSGLARNRLEFTNWKPPASHRGFQASIIGEEGGVSWRHNNTLNRLALFILLVILAQASSAMAWWDEKWQYRKKITIDTSESGAELKGNASEFPLLIRLHTGNFNFTRAREDGSDLRFINADDKEPLKFHIESYEPVDEMALVWVRIPRLAGGNSQQSIWMYYGNKAAPAAQAAAASFAGISSGYSILINWRKAGSAR